ncbi:hypothetical protein [Streptomyces sp. NPDC002104]
MPAWLPPVEYVETIARATSYACLYFTDTAGRPVQLRATYSTEIWQWPGEQIAGIVLDREEHSEVRVHSVREWEALMSPVNFARLREIDAARRTGTVAYMEL